MKPTRTLSTPFNGVPSTETREGMIPAILVNINGKYNYWLVVKVRKKAGSTSTSGETNALRAPMRDDNGRLVYAVPGGGSYVPA